MRVDVDFCLALSYNKENKNVHIMKAPRSYKYKRLKKGDWCVNSNGTLFFYFDGVKFIKTKKRPQGISSRRQFRP